jgi:hypothetical protein
MEEITIRTTQETREVINDILELLYDNNYSAVEILGILEAAKMQLSLDIVEEVFFDEE